MLASTKDLRYRTRRDQDPREYTQQQLQSKTVGGSTASPGLLDAVQVKGDASCGLTAETKSTQSVAL